MTKTIRIIKRMMQRVSLLGTFIYFNAYLILTFYFTMLFNNRLILGMLTEKFSILFLKNWGMMFSVSVYKFIFFQIEQGQKCWPENISGLVVGDGSFLMLGNWSQSKSVGKYLQVKEFNVLFRGLCEMGHWFVFFLTTSCNIRNIACITVNDEYSFSFMFQWDWKF